MGNTAPSLSLLEKTRAQGLPAIIAFLQKKLKKQFMIMDDQGNRLYASGGFPANEDLTTVLAAKEQCLYRAAEKSFAARISKNEACLLVVIRPVLEPEVQYVNSLLEEIRLSLFFCLNTMLETRRRFSEIEKDLMERLFGQNREQSDDFLPFGNFNLNNDKPYVIQLIHLEGVEDPATIKAAIDQLVEYTVDNKLPSMRSIYWHNNLVHIIPAIYERNTFELHQEWPEFRISEIYRKLAEEKFNIKLSIGIGQIYPLSELYKSYREAQIALAFRGLPEKEGYVQRFADLGFFRYVFSRDTEEIKKYVVRTLGEIIDYDNHRQSDFLTTLRILIDNGLNWKDTAEKCKVHVNTIHYRVERIEKFLKRDLRDMETRFDLFVALKVWDVLNALDVIDDAYVGVIGRPDDPVR